MTMFWRFCKSREDRTGWVHLKGANSVVISGLSFGNISWHWVVCLCSEPQCAMLNEVLSTTFLLYTWCHPCEKRNQALCILCATENSACLGTRLGGCGLSRKCVEDCYKETCVKLVLEHWWCAQNSCNFLHAWSVKFSSNPWRTEHAQRLCSIISSNLL